MISIHPNNYDLQRSRGRDFTAAVKKQRQLGTTVVGPTEDWVKYLAAADILVTDFTSLSLYFVPLRRPIVCVPLAETLGRPDGLMYAVERIASPLTAPENLADALAKARQLDISQEHRQLAEQIFSHRRNSWAQMSRHIYNLLDLPEPTI